MEHIWGEILIINGKTADVLGYAPDPSAVIFYEVIRVIGGKYLFLNDHLERLRVSCGDNISNYPGKSTLSSQLQTLIHSSSTKDGNVKIMVYDEARQCNVLCFFTSHFYPTTEDYKKGVAVKTFRFERPDPNIKQWNNTFRNRVNKFIRDENIYEAILLNEQGKLTEGSRSNLFFIDKNERVITSPSSQVLPGITRKYVIQICAELHISIEERAIDLQEVTSMKACFISGTSPKVLPVQKLDAISFNAGNQLVGKILQSFNQLLIL